MQDCEKEKKPAVNDIRTSYAKPNGSQAGVECGEKSARADVTKRKSGVRSCGQVLFFENDAVMAVVAGNYESKSQNAHFFLTRGAATQPSGVVQRTYQANGGFTNGREFAKKVLQLAR
jgi:hypothetical protein